MLLCVFHANVYNGVRELIDKETQQIMEQWTARGCGGNTKEEEIRNRLDPRMRYGVMDPMYTQAKGDRKAKKKKKFQHKKCSECG